MLTIEDFMIWFLACTTAALMLWALIGTIPRDDPEEDQARQNRDTLNGRF